MSPTSAPTLRALFVHAHPDDETIATGTTLARYSADPDTAVTLVTCTLGEEGEILIPEIAHLAADQEDKLGPHRHTELAAAMRALGVTDWRLLGGPGTYRDSGMIGTPPNDRPDAFWRADLLQAASALAGIIRELRPSVLVTYDDFGGYGHPDHIQAHRVAMYALVLAEAESFRPDLGVAHSVPRVYWHGFPNSVMREAIEALRAAGQTDGLAAIDPENLPFSCADELVTTAIDGATFHEAKVNAMRAYASQISLDSGFFALNATPTSTTLMSEYFRLVRGEVSGVLDEKGRETDLFAGLR